MGRGSSKVKQSNNALRSQDGGIIETSTPLVFGDRDPFVRGTVRERIDQIERERLTATVEEQYFLSEEGERLGKQVFSSSDHSRTRITSYDLGRTDTMTHNHPRDGEGNVLGGTFSGDDINGWVRNDGMYTMRASASEGTYSITALDGFAERARGFRNAYGRVRNTNRRTYEDTIGSIQRSFGQLTMTRNEAVRAASRAFNDMMVSNHNWLLANQDKYHYHYTLEPR